MTYIAHISDIHLLPLPKLEYSQLANKRITGYFNLKYNRSQGMRDISDETALDHLLHHDLDHIIISGDLTNLGSEQEMQLAKRWVDKLAQKCSISLCFGNHDAYLKDSYAKACEIFSEYIPAGFPCVNIVGQVAIVNVNSAIATPVFCASGYFDNRQSAALCEILSNLKAKDMFRIINIHHPPIAGAVRYHKQLFGKDKFWQAVDMAGAELILHGHSHQASLHYKNNIPIVGVRNFAASRGAIYNIFDIKMFHVKHFSQRDNQSPKSGHDLNFTCQLQRFGFAIAERIDLLERKALY